MGLTLEDLRLFLQQRQVEFGEEPIQHGTQLRCVTGEIFNHYPKRNNVVCQGRSTELSQAVKGWADSGLKPRQPEAGEGRGESEPTGALGPSTDVFIVYGHDGDARDKLELLLRRMGLTPIVLANLTASGDTIIEKLERYLGSHSNVGFACALLTPDDEGYKAGQLENKKYRARQNVILELGMVLARLGRKRVAILHKGSVELPSDIGGLLYIPFEERVDEAAGALYRELKEAGYDASYPT